MTSKTPTLQSDLTSLIRQNLITIEPHQSVLEAARLMENQGVGCVLVLSNGRPRGILTDRDIVIRCVAPNLDIADTTVENILTESLATVREQDGLLVCARKMREAGVHRIPVVNAEDKVIGVISFDDLMRVMSHELSMLCEGLGASSLRNAA